MYCSRDNQLAKRVMAAVYGSKAKKIRLTSTGDTVAETVEHDADATRKFETPTRHDASTDKAGRRMVGC